ncbi:MAG: TetR/AcrR family transcriptional regulator [Thermoleophilia bacterium]
MATTPLSRDAVLRTALRLIDERGLRGLTMRALGGELGVEAMSLYRHVPGKAEVERGVVGLLIDELEASLDTVGRGADDWRATLERFARAFRKLAVDHPNAFSLFAEQPTRGWSRARAGVERSIGQLIAAGLDEAEAAVGMRTMIRYVIGFSLTEVVSRADDRTASSAAELVEEGFPLTAGVIEDIAQGSQDDLFDAGLELLLDGLASRLANRGVAAR